MWSHQLLHMRLPFLIHCDCFFKMLRWHSECPRYRGTQASSADACGPQHRLRPVQLSFLSLRNVTSFLSCRICLFIISLIWFVLQYNSRRGRGYTLILPSCEKPQTARVAKRTWITIWHCFLNTADKQTRSFVLLPILTCVTHELLSQHT